MGFGLCLHSNRLLQMPLHLAPQHKWLSEMSFACSIASTWSSLDTDDIQRIQMTKNKPIEKDFF